MVHAGNRLVLVCINIFLLACNAEGDTNSVRDHLRLRQREPFATVGNEDAGAKAVKNTFVVNITMPGAQSIKAEEYLCTSSKRLPSRKKYYIVEYEPHAHASTAHHILLFGCRYPAKRAKNSYFRCPGSVCKGDERIIYAWARNAKGLKMPKGVGFAVGKNTGINYIVMQVHYARALKKNEKDYSGIGIHMTRSRVKHSAEIYMLGSGEAKIPPRSIGFHANFACRYRRPYDMVPFAYRTHAHSTGRVISGYRVRRGKWKLIGIGNPQLPQAFYPIPPKERTVVHKGDIIAGRCTYDTPHRNRWTIMGPTSKDEMCNLYLMFYKVYRSGRRSRRRYRSDCMDIQYRLPKLKFPASSDKLPESMKTNQTQVHHHHHGMMGDFDDRIENHHGMMGSDPDDESDEENEDNDEKEPGDDDLDDENNLLIDGSKNENDRKSSAENDRISDENDSEPGFDFETPADHDLDDRLIKEQPNSDEHLSEHSSHDDLVSRDKKNNRDGTKIDTKHNNNKNGKKIKSAMEADLDSLVAPKKDHRKDGNIPNAIETPKVDGDWPYYREKWNDIGQVSALGMAGENMVLLHRADRVWDEKAFDIYERLSHKYRTSRISTPTVLHFDPNTGKVIKRWGKHRFYLPHGLTVDNDGNIWITDVGAHQVYKFASGQLDKPALTLGVSLVPGYDEDHFCKPADVAVESNGNFFVADGYCNSRILKFSADGTLIQQWGKAYKVGYGLPGHFDFKIPHSLALDDKKKLLYVANRELGRIHCFTTHGKFVKLIKHQDFGGRLFAVSFTPANGGLLYAISGPSLKNNGPSPSGFTIDPKTKHILRKWSPFTKGFTRPHDIHVLVDGSAVFVSEIGPNRVWKFNIHRDSQTHPVIIHHQQDEERVSSRNQTVLHDELNDEENEKEPAKNPSYRLKRPNEDDGDIVPALVVVVVLATPIALICAAATIQHLRFKYRRDKVLRKRNRESLGTKNGSSCFGRTKMYYHDERRGFDKLLENDSEESEDDYFVRKGAI